ncbi:MAG: MFS transporter [Bacteroidia bacterium]|nr:MFS transporter [Bacteroidia bacterium]
MKLNFITKNILFLSLISFFTDVASEMLYPVIPLYLSGIGISITGISIMEGLAETISALSKTYFGIWSDRIRKRKIFVIAGYGLSAVSKPLMIVFQNYFWILFNRVADRLGKGIRTAPRDALLSDESSEANKGKVFGFHRSIDTLGAAVGPAITLALLSLYQWNYQNLFLLSFFPGLLAMLFSFLIIETNKVPLEKNLKKIKINELFDYWKISSRDYKIASILLIVFYVFNSSDMLLLLKAKTNGIQDHEVILLYIIYNISYAMFAFPFGIIGDKLGLKNTIAMGLFFFGIVYAGISFFNSWADMLILFILYGIYSAAIEGNIKALLSNLSDQKHTASAIGLFTTFQSFTYLISNSLAGWLWASFNSSFPFILSGIVAIFIAFMMLFIPSSNKTQTNGANSK